MERQVIETSLGTGRGRELSPPCSIESDVRALERLPSPTSSGAGLRTNREKTGTEVHVCNPCAGAGGEERQTDPWSSLARQPYPVSSPR